MIIWKGKQGFTVEINHPLTVRDYALYQESLIDPMGAGATPASVGVYDGASAFLCRHFTVDGESVTFPFLEEVGWEPSQFNQLLGYFNSPPDGDPDWTSLEVDGITLTKKSIPVREYYEVVVARSRFSLMVEWLMKFFAVDGQAVAANEPYPFEVVKALVHRAGKC